LTKPTVDALCHVDVVSSRSAGAVVTLFCIDRNSLRRTDSFAEFASNASLFTTGVAPQDYLYFGIENNISTYYKL
jgi:hypothetical protein